MSEIERLRALLAEATPRRWYHLIDDYGDGHAGSMFLTHEAVLRDAQTPLALALSWADAALIAAAVNALPALLDVADAARAHLRESCEEAGACGRPWCRHLAAALARLDGAS